MILGISSVQTPFAFLAAAGLVISTLASGGCGSPSDTEVFLAEYVPFSASGVDTDVIFPREEGASRFLIRNWPPMRTLEGNTLWVHGTWARVGFFAVADRPPTLVAEASPYSHPDAPTQTLTVSLNNEELESLPMRPGWKTYEIELPAEHVTTGWNEIELRFAHSLRPADFDPQSDDRRSLAAEFRRIEMRGAARRPYWSERPEQVALAWEQHESTPSAAPAQGPEGTASGDPASADFRPGAEYAALLAAEPGSASIDMPADSFLEIYVFPRIGVEIAGAVTASFEGPASGSIRAVVDVFEPGISTEIWSADLGSAAASAEVSADLSPWANRAIGLRLRVFGDANGVVSWERLRVTESPASGDSPPLPNEILAPPILGALDRPDIFLVILDAARADAFEGDLGAELAPNVQALAAEGTAFSRAWAPSSWTGQTIPALWSGMSPDTVGIEHWGSRLPPQVTTFPELLNEAGYHTVLWSQHNIYGARNPLRNGFEVFGGTDSTRLQQRSLLPSIADMVEADRPTLAVIHLLPPHTPYVPPAPFVGSRSSWYEGEQVSARLLNRFDSLYSEEQTELREEIRRAAIDKYEENVRFADHLVGRLIDDLRSQNRYDDALVIVTSDHGEAFYEHGRFLHGNLVYEEFLRVPLVVKWPRSFDGFVPRVNAPVSLIDIAPTLIDGLTIDDERARYQGRSLMSLATGGPAPNRMLYAYTSGTSDPGRAPKPQYALLWEDFKLIRDERRGHSALYRLTDDPGEDVDLSSQEELKTAWLTQTLRLAQAQNTGFLLRIGGAQMEALDAETVRRLQALGYLR